LGELEERDEHSPILSREESAQQTMMDSKIRFEALTALLIEKERSREESSA
jgi:hypothetical protein